MGSSLPGAPPPGMTTLPILRLRDHGEGLRSLYLESRVEASPGQFVLLWLPGVDEKPFSISDLKDGVLEITVKAVGPFTRLLMACRPGDRVGIRGPFGVGFDLRERQLLVGGGIGAAPIRFLARTLAGRSKPFGLVLGARSRAELPFQGEFGRLGAAFATDDGTLGRMGLVTELVSEAIEERGWRTISACGPEAMLVAVRELARLHHLPVQLCLERYMKCGVGVCGSCCLDGSGVRLCTEGPVLTDRLLEGTTELGRPSRDATGARKPE